MSLRVLLLLAACSAAYAPAGAGQLPVQPAGPLDAPAPVARAVSVTFANGLVTVVANNATVADVLAEWTRVGGSTFVNAAKIPPTERLTLRLENETELRALEIILRSVAGYAVAPKAPDTTSASSLAKVYVMPARRPAVITYSAPAPPAQMGQMGQSGQMGASNLLDGSDPRLPRPMGTPPRPDDDGPVLVQVGGASPLNGVPATPGPFTPIASQSGAQPMPGQTSPGLGATSSRPGVPVGASPRPVATPTRRPGGGGG